MRSLRVALAALLIAVSVTLAPPPAPAAENPPSGPQLIHSYGFEGTGFTKGGAFTPRYDSHWVIGKNPVPPTGVSATYYWGMEPSSRHSGTYGLWCSAYDSSTGWYSFNWATYQPNTSGRARLVLPELADYYSSQLQFWYLMPSRGAGDTGSFVLAWGPPPLNYETWEDDSYFSLTSSWTKLTYDLTNELSRRSGEIWWEFNNKVEGGEQYPTAGQGATIDDVTVYGYKYGPVRDVESRATAQGLELSWSRPFQSAQSSAEDPRALTYRVWRRPASTTTWTEVTATRLVDESSRVAYTDTSALQGVDYVYRILAYDTGTGTGYGEIVDHSARMPRVRLEVAGSASPSLMRAGTSSLFTYRVSNTGEVPLRGLALADSFGTVAADLPDVLAPGASFEATRQATPDATLTNHVVASGTDGEIQVGASTDIPVTVVDPGVSVFADADATEVVSGDQVEFGYQVQNTGDTTLEDITVADAYGQVTEGVPLSLAPGASFTATRIATPVASVDNAVLISASGAGFRVEDTDSVAVTVRHPSVAVSAAVTPETIVAGSSATFTYTVTNTGDCALDALELADAWGQITGGVPATLATGGEFTVSRTVSPTASVLDTVTVSAAALGHVYSATDVRSLLVKEPRPGLDVTATVAPGVVPVGSSATFTYEVRNTGNVAVQNIVLTDAMGALVDGVSVSLAPGEAFSVQREAAPTTSLLNRVDAGGDTIAGPVSAFDTAYLQVTHPLLDITADVSPAVVPEGSPAMFTYTVTNSGDVTLSSLTLVDDYDAITTGVPSSLAPGQSYQVEREVSPGLSLVNGVTATGVGTGRLVSATGSAALTVTHPAIAVEALADEPAVAQGDPVTFTYRITNSGDVALGGMSALDSMGPLTVGMPATLAPGSSVDVQRVVAPLASLTNEVQVIATGTGKQVTASDQVALTVTHPSVAVDVSLDRSASVVGEALTFTYAVRNTGDVEITGITLQDSFGTVTAGVPPVLAAGAQFSATRVTTPDDSGTNAVTLAAVGTARSLSAEDSADYEIYHPELELGVSPSARGVQSGGRADYDLTVTNTGDVPLTGVQVAAKIGSTTADSEQIGLLPAGESRSVLLSPSVSGVAGTVVGLQFSAWGDYGEGQTWEGQTIPVSAAATAEIIESRVEGTDRVHTAIDASQKAFLDGADAVVIATGYDFPDALSAAGLAGAANGPLLLVKGAYVHDDVLAEIRRLQPSRAYIVGGTSVVSAAAEAQLRALVGSAGMPAAFRVQPRIAGTNRYGTAQLVAAEVARLGGDTSTVFLATGLNFPDALAASSLAARMRSPILLTKPTALPSQTDAALTALKPDRVIICGGEAVVSEAVRSHIAGSSAYGNPQVIRIAGAQRYETARLLVEWAAGDAAGQPDLAPTGVDGIYLATGTDYPDALAGGVLAGMGGPQWRPLLLTKPLELRGEVGGYIAENGSIGFVSGVGGSAVLSDNVLAQARSTIQ